MIRGFGEYGFPESHAASFARLVYVSAWLKWYYPAAFTVALLNSQPMGFYAPAQLVSDARQHGVPVRPADVNHSAWDCTLESNWDMGHMGPIRPIRESPALRLGFRLIGGMREAEAIAIVAARADEPFRSVADLARRARLGRATLEMLADADAFGSLAVDRRAALWQSLGQDRVPSDTDLFAEAADGEPSVALPTLAPIQQVFADYITTGLSLKGHPIGFCRDELDRLRVTPAAQLTELSHGRRVAVAGMVILRQRPGTANGITFVTLEDETGVVNLIVRPDMWERYRAVARGSRAWVAHGAVERQGDVIHVMVHRIDDLSTALGDVRPKSRDFR
jgi:error-prone DNA polymerase